ncbi:MAG: hypothetical protein MZU79_06285 [Anaerotruncus sp.]|nr:hypothetical protein [Anaerotruncus sp.]
MLGPQRLGPCLRSSPRRGIRQSSALERSTWGTALHFDTRLLGRRARSAAPPVIIRPWAGPTPARRARASAVSFGEAAGRRRSPTPPTRRPSSSRTGACRRSRTRPAGRSRTLIGDGQHPPGHDPDRRPDRRGTSRNSARCSGKARSPSTRSPTPPPPSSGPSPSTDSKFDRGARGDPIEALTPLGKKGPRGLQRQPPLHFLSLGPLLQATAASTTSAFRPRTPKTPTRALRCDERPPRHGGLGDAHGPRRGPARSVLSMTGRRRPSSRSSISTTAAAARTPTSTR